MRRFGMRALLAGVMSLGLASTAWAGFGNRTDVLDIDNGMFADSVDSPVVNNWAFMEQQGDTVWASGSINNSSGPKSATTFTGIQWFAFEPDQSKRNTNSTGGSLQQKDQVALIITVHGVTAFGGIVPGCKAKIQAKAPKGSTLFSDVSQGNWSMNCNKKIADAVTLTADQLTALQTDLGKVVSKNGTVNIKGKCSDANCDVVF
jgi:hypothetical protein